MLKIFITALVMTSCMACKEVSTPIDRQIDPARMKTIVYPRLTAREGLGLTLPVPPAEHPRLFFRKSDLPTIKMNAEHTLLKDSREKVEQSASFPTDGKLKQNVTSNFDLQVINAIEARAFMYVLTDDREKGIEAVDFIFNLHNTLIINLQKGDVCRDIGRAILATAIVYDWCYDLMPPTEKQQLIAVMESLATEMEVEWPRLIQGSITGHGVEAQVARDILAFGIAVYDEKPEIYQRAAGRIFAEFLPAQNFGYQSGHHHQGSAYGPYRFQWEMYTTLIFDRMGYTGLNRELQGKIPYYWIYTRRPDGQLLRDGDDWWDQNHFGFYWSFPDLAYVASYYQDPLLMGEAIRQGLNYYDNSGSLYHLLLINPNVPANNDLAALPLTRYFPSPFGGMVARTDWNSGLTANTVVAEMRIKERHFANHQHLDAGSFQMYYKGPLAVNSGIYQGTEGAYGSAHFANYYQRTIAHNCMLVYDPNERFGYGWYQLTSTVNDGGQKWANGSRQPTYLSMLLQPEYKSGEVIAYDFGPDQMRPEYSYLKGDITAAYTNKVKNHQRAFVFLNLDNFHVPAALIVYDYMVSSNKNFKKTWLLHCVQEPVFSGNVCTVVRNEKGYSGKLVNTVLLPQPQNIIWEKTGGKGNEYSVNGKNYPQHFYNKDNSGDGAVWRIELSPKTPAETDVFLNVMQLTDVGNHTLMPVEAVETTQMTGVQISDRMILFSKNGALVNTTVNLNIRGSGTFKVLITDLEKGNWEITGTQSTGMVSNEHNLIYFQAVEGNYMIAKK